MENRPLILWVQRGLGTSGTPIRSVGWGTTPVEAPQPRWAATQGPGLPAGRLGSLVVHELSRVDAILLVQLLVLPGCHTGLLG